MLNLFFTCWHSVLPKHEAGRKGVLVDSCVLDLISPFCRKIFPGLKGLI